MYTTKLLPSVTLIKTNLAVINSCRKYHALPFQHAKEIKKTFVKSLLKQNTNLFAVPIALKTSKPNKQKPPKRKPIEPWKPEKTFQPPKPYHEITIPNYDGIELPERRTLPVFPKVPYAVLGTKPYKMPTAMHYVRGEEEVHTDFQYGQYGIVALRGGHLKHGHFEMMRMGINKKLDTERSFAVYRIEAPWFSHTKKRIGEKMGGGQGNISFYTTPVKAKRVILEVAGKITFEEVQRMLETVAHKLPFPAAAMSQEMIEEQRRDEERLEKENINPWTFKYIIQNNLLGSRMWAKKEMDLKYFGKYD